MRTKTLAARPCALAIGGLDPGGGAGIAADLRAFHAAGVFGCAVVAVVTVQSTDGLVASRPLAPSLVVEQASEVVRVENVRAFKLGALGSVSNVRAVAKWLRTLGDVPVVLDPVMLPTRGRAGARLLSESAVTVMRDVLLPCATLVTANAPEAEALTGARVHTVPEAIRAARAIVALGAKAALVKGGHLGTRRDVVDVLALGEGAVVELRGARLALAPTHGGGCVLASLIAGGLAGRRTDAVSRSDIEAAVRRARRTHQRALEGAIHVGGAMRVLVPRA